MSLDSLNDEINDARNSSRFDQYNMSINELSLMYRNGELLCALPNSPWSTISFWDDTRKSLLIESILLRIPIPQIVVKHDDEGTWTVLDGKQRLLTVFAFMGIKPMNAPSQHLVLESTTTLPSLGNAQWADLSDNEKLLFKRYQINVLIVRHSSDDSNKQEQFYCRF